MPNQEFAFKQFTIHQEKCAMKVGTDAVLLGAWVTPNNPKAILDIGTGTGVIALMIAQKTEGIVDAIEIDENAYQQATENVAASKWKDRVYVHHTSLQDFSKNATHKYDLIVSNPPYFVDSFKSNAEARNSARHADQLPFSELIKGVLNLLDENGAFCVIMPVTEGYKLRELACANNLYLTKLTLIKTKKEKTEKRFIMQFEKQNKKLIETELVIEKNDRHAYTAEYIELTKDYYLYF
ncbi:MAG: methyltransferase [Bacteroidota bacterium]